MTNYADYTFYVNDYKGSLSEPLFNSLIVKASREIDKNVNRELTATDLANYKVKYVACELCDFLNTNKIGETQSNVSSISIDGVSKVFKQKTSQEISKEKSNILNGLPEDLMRYI